MVPRPGIPRGRFGTGRRPMQPALVDQQSVGICHLHVAYRPPSYYVRICPLQYVPSVTSVFILEHCRKYGSSSLMRL